MNHILKFFRGFNSHDPELDPATVGISYVDILFALAVGVVLDPVKSWASSPAKNPLPLPEVLNLAVSLTVILCSFIGYHNSTNRPRFKIRFVNISFIKFFLDISMVVVYFILAGFAAQSPPTLRAETLLILIAFALYLMWDFAGWYEASDPRYKAVWCAAMEDELRTDVNANTPWRGMERKRAIPTAVGLFLTLGLCLYTWKTAVPPTPQTVFIVDGMLIAVLFIYRVAKDTLWRTPKEQATTSPAPVVSPA